MTNLISQYQDFKNLWRLEQKDKNKRRICDGAKDKIQHLYLKKALKPVWEVKV